MEKVKLTQEQANVIESIKNDNESLKSLFMVKHCMDWAHPHFHKMSDELLARLIFANEQYEIEPEFKVGDWVVRTSENGKNHELGRVLKINAINPNYVFERIDIAHSIKEVRHATPEEIAKEKERRWWTKHDRDVLEFRKGDILIDEDNQPWTVSSQCRGRINLTERHAFMPTNKFYEFGWKVASFVEDRKDIKHEQPTT